MFSSDENRNRNFSKQVHKSFIGSTAWHTTHFFSYFPCVLEFSSKIPLMLRLSIQYSFVRTWHILLVWETIYRKYRLDKQLFITTHIAQILFEYKKLLLWWFTIDPIQSWTHLTYIAWIRNFLPQYCAQVWMMKLFNFGKIVLVLNQKVF